MKVQVLSPVWGNEDQDLYSFMNLIDSKGYDGLDTWIPTKKNDYLALIDYRNNRDFFLVAHQHQADGSTFKKFLRSFAKQLCECEKIIPNLINSHTGRDYFTTTQFLDLIYVAEDFSAKSGITVLHETHRGRMGYCPQMIAELFEKNSNFLITADFSHWTCVTESMLENFKEVLDEAIRRTRHVHARIGFEQGPQVPDPRAPEWQYAVDKFLTWWDKIYAVNKTIGTETLSFTTEFGPFPYMPVFPYTVEPVAVQFEVNCFIKDLLRNRYISDPSPNFNIR
ncbi:sugar phosphate isomerase/epimerase [Pedobacter psychroterrae]|uniref:Sugar phosphate isomerase/epimerase n=1 Tax=Pedobacter psychroterrae TaxID=2530453 RepID=A0A4R0NQ45_9SPHI|nr:sugar phosphate isomerase/epimerase [Pedobacter psychroterrae]TCD03152.1 sugar phosphate isomerase/epimerase [Pedobacter psychroterrae]